MPHLRWDDHSTHVMNLVRKLYKNLEFTDCTLDTNGGLVHGHKTLLVACSPYLKKLIVDHEGMERIPLKGVKYDDMKLVLDFMYFGEVNVPVTHVSSMIETARLLQIPSLSDFSLIISEKSSSSRCSDGSAEVNATEGLSNLLKYDDPDLFVEEDMVVVCNPDIPSENEAGWTAACENVCDSKRHTGNVFKDSSPTQEEILTKSNIPNFCVTKKNYIDQGTVNFQEDSTPFSFLAVSLFPVKSEHIENGLNTVCSSLSCMEDPLEENRVSDDTMKVIKGEKNFQRESQVKIEVDEEEDNSVSESVDDCKPMEINYMSPGMNDINVLKNTENICVKESLKENLMLKEIGGCNSFKSCFAERTKDLRIEFESICDISKCELSEVNPVDTGSDNNSINEDNNLRTSNECEAAKVSRINFKEDLNEVSDVSSKKRFDIKELSVVLERIDSSKIKTAFEESSFASRTYSQPTAKENNLKRRSKEDFKCFLCDYTKPKARPDDLLTLGANRIANFSESNESMFVRASDKLFSCIICNSSFKYKNTLISHNRIHNGDKPFKCDHCGAAFSLKSNLKVHLRIHTGDKPFLCDICGAAFADGSRLKRHSRIHTGDKPFKCDICGTAFPDRSSLIYHSRSHAKPFKCTICGVAFSRKDSLKSHLRTHTGERPFRCDICAASFADRSHCVRHKWIHTDDKPFTCDICGAKTSSKGDLIKHMRKKSHIRIHTANELFKV